MNRRKFFGFGAMGALALTTLSNTACFLSQNVYQSILAYVAVGLQAVQSVVDLLSGSGVIQVGTGTAIDTIINLIKVAFADLQTAVTNYINAPAANKSTLLGEISTALATVEAYIQQFWNDLSIPDAKLASLVQGLLGIILSTLAAFATQLPAPASTPAIEKAAKLAKQIPVTPVKRNTKQFKSDWNAALAAAGQSQYEIH